MGEIRFDNVNLVLADSNWQVREGLKSRLFGEGFRNVRVATRCERLRTAVATIGPDLVIADTDLPDGDVCDLFYAIRHHEVGDNPFLPVIATASTTELPLVRRVVDSGADDLLLKPISTEFLFARIENLIHARKPFVVTTDYIGPDRRMTPRPAAGTPLFDVPNSLKAMATGETDRARLQQGILAAAAVINEEKMGRHAVQITYLVERILAVYHNGGFTGVVADHLDRLLYVAEDISRRMVGTRFAHVSDLCQSLRQITRSLIAAGREPSPKDRQILRELSRAITGAFRRGEEAAAISRDISRSVAEMGGGASRSHPPLYPTLTRVI